MLMDKETGCAKLYSEFGISVSPTAIYFNNFYRNITGRKNHFRPVLFHIKVFEIMSAKQTPKFRIPNSELRIPNYEFNYGSELYFGVVLFALDFSRKMWYNNINTVYSVGLHYMTAGLATAMRKVRASQSRVTDNISRGRP